MNRTLGMDELQATKQRIGPLQHLDLTDYSFVEAHWRLGEAVGPQARAILHRKLSSLSATQVGESLTLVRQFQSALQARLELLSTPIPVGALLAEYVQCLRAWAEGADLAAAASALETQDSGGDSFTVMDLALLLQHDNVGCQTGVYRAADGTILLWHTEEDVEEKPGSRFDAVRIATFRDEPRCLGAFIYPDLLPGPAYCWRDDGYVQAVDGLILNPYTGSDGLLANIATWITWRLGGSIQDVIEALGPFHDGYAILGTYPEGSQVTAVKVEFVGELCHSEILDTNPGSYLFQVNAFSEAGATIARTYEALSPEDRRSFAGRVRRTIQAVGTFSPSEVGSSHCLRLLASRLGGPNAYANSDVKSYLIARVYPTWTELWIGAGPAFKTDELEHFNLSSSGGES